MTPHAELALPNTACSRGASSELSAAADAETLGTSMRKAAFCRQRITK